MCDASGKVSNLEADEAHDLVCHTTAKCEDRDRPKEMYNRLLPNGDYGLDIALIQEGTKCKCIACSLHETITGAYNTSGISSRFSICGPDVAHQESTISRR
ncbi:hypothetical protein CHS0354_037218 [Potamilus streckersoni]|uniref:Uncharacterized protein n=1 Tax=Potamilus streckersoni TaxID=2493646 RepID=A0AAE0W2K0_9BIVA|nr:hypothetical protein CHS0354_037218 [Potamilus streckersoni]